MDYVATFYTHYGAMRFNKYCAMEGIAARLAPVPRELSSSCGICVHFTAESPPVIAEHEEMEGCYIHTQDDKYVPTTEG